MAGSDSKDTPEPSNLEEIREKPVLNALRARFDILSTKRQAAFMAMLNEERDVFCSDELAEKLAVRLTTVHRWLASEEIKAKKIGHRWFITKVELERIINTRKV